MVKGPRVAKSPTPRMARATLVVTLVVTALLAWWRLDSVLLGPDPDSDSYGHFTIARQILVEPGNHGVHWVWLPLFHYLEVPLAALDAPMDAVRYINVLLWAAVALVLYFYLLKPKGEGSYPATAALAAILAGLCPIGMQMGTTAQPEPIFALAVLGFAYAFERARFLPAALMLTAAVMLRYEAWGVLAFTGLVVGWRLLKQRKLLQTPGGLWPYAVLLLPIVAIVVWGVVRIPFDRHIFGFVGDTRRFANDAQKMKSALDAGWGQAFLDVGYYLVKVAWRVYGPAILLAPFGAVALVRRHPMLALSGGACMFFITLSWLMRSSLGLDRHFVSVIPAYATLIALGAEAVGAWLISTSEKLKWITTEKGRRRGLDTLRGVLALAAVASAGVNLYIWMGHWRGSIANGYPDRRAVAAYLRDLPPEQLLFCDEATVEVITELPRGRFERRNIDRKDVRAKLRATTQEQREVHVASWAGKLTRLQKDQGGEIVFRAPGASETSGMAVLRLRAGQ